MGRSTLIETASLIGLPECAAEGSIHEPIASAALWFSRELQDAA